MADLASSSSDEVLAKFDFTMEDGEDFSVILPDNTDPKAAQAYAEAQYIGENEGGDPPRGTRGAPPQTFRSKIGAQSGPFDPSNPLGLADAAQEPVQLSVGEKLEMNGFHPTARVDKDIRLTMSLGLPGREEKDLKTLIKKRDGYEPKVGKDPIYGWFIEHDDSKGKPLEGPSPNRRVVLDAKGDLEAGDFYAAFPEVGMTVSELVGGLAGFGIGTFAGGPTSGVVGAITAEALTSYGMETWRLNTGKSQGLDIKDHEIHEQAALRAALTGAGAAAGPLMGALFTRITGRIPSFLKDFAKGNEDALKTSLEIGKRVQDAFNKRFNAHVRFDSAAASGDPSLNQAAIAAEGRGVGQVLRDNSDANQAEIQNALEIAFRSNELNSKALGDEQVQRNVRNHALESHRNKERRIAATAQREQDKADSALDNLGGTDKIAAVSDFRQVTNSIKNKNEFPHKQMFVKFSQNRSNRIELTETRAFGLRNERELSQSIFKQFQKEDTELTEIARRAGIEISSVWKPDPNNPGKFFKLQKRPATLAAVQMDLSNIRDILRQSDEVLSPKHRRIFEGLEAALRRDRNRSLMRQDPKLLDEVLEAERGLAIAKDDLGHGFVSFIMREEARTKPGTGHFRASSDQVVKKVLSSAEGAQQLVGTLMKYKHNGGEWVLGKLRKGVLNHIAENPGLINRKAAELEAILSPAQWKQVQDAGTAQKNAKAMLKRAGQVSARLQGMWGKRLGSTEPNVLAEGLFQPGRLTDFRRTRSILKSDPDQLNAFDAEIKRLAIMGMRDEKGDLTADNLEKMMTTGLAGHMRDTFGETWVKDMRMIQGVLRRTERGGGVSDLAEMFKEGMLHGVMRFVRVAAPPLTAKGRAVTASVGLNREYARERLVEILHDPKQLHRIANMRGKDVKSKGVQAILGGVGMHYVSDVLDLVGLTDSEE